MRSRLKGIFEGLLIAIGLAVIVCCIYFHRHRENARAVRRHCHKFFTFAQVTLEQLGDFDEGADLIIMNHQSVADILCLEAYHPRNICWVAKQQLGEIPFYGYALTGPEMILIDREDKRGLISLLQAIKQKLGQRRPIVIFPEGTRNKHPERFLPFKPGAKIIAEKFGLKIQPIVLINTRNVYSTSPFQATSNVARMVLLKPFYVDEHPSTEVFYRDEDSRERAKLAHKVKGLLPIYEQDISYHIGASNKVGNETSRQKSKGTGAGKPNDTASREQESHVDSHLSPALESHATQMEQAPAQVEQARQDSKPPRSPLPSWYEELKECMQAVHTQHSRAFSSK